MYRIVVIAFFLFSFNFFGQGFRTRYYIPNAVDNTSKAIFEISPGNYIGAGFVNDTINGTQLQRIAVMGMNANGSILWYKKYGNTTLEHLDNALIIRSYHKQGNYFYHTGCAQDNITNKQVGVLIKFDFNGDTVWQRIYRDPDPLEDVIPQMITSSIDGGFLITGFFQNWSSNPYCKVLLIKTDANGNELWRRKIGKASPDVADGKAIVQDSISKKIAIVGYQYIGNNNIYDNLLILDSLGDKITQTNFTSLGGVLHDVIQTKDKKIVALGWRYYSETIGGNNLMSSFAVKFDINNPIVPIWKIDGFDKNVLANGFTCLREFKNGDFLIGGSLDTIMAPENYLTRITKIDANGNIKWNKYYDYKINNIDVSNTQGVYSIELTSDGGWIVAIAQVNFPRPNPFFFVKYDSTGCDTTLAYCKYLSEVNITKFYSKGEKIEIYPNPVSDALNVNISNANLNEYKLRLLNVLGQEIELGNEPMNNREETGLRIQTNKLSKGIYFLEVYRDGKMITTEKIIKE